MWLYNRVRAGLGRSKLERITCIKLLSARELTNPHPKQKVPDPAYRRVCPDFWELDWLERFVRVGG
jgi:hypothetical protein